MTVVVIGGGAVGLLLAGQIASSKQPVALLGRVDMVQTLSTRPLRLVHAGHEQTIIGVTVATDPQGLPAAYQAPDHAVVCVKGYDMPAALATLTALRPRQILTLQNGLGHEEQLAAVFGADSICAGALTSAVKLPAPGQVEITKAGGLGLACVGLHTELAAWVDLFRQTNVTVRTYADFRAMKWSKALMNILGNATAAILDLPVATVYADPRLLALERQAFVEGLAVMQHLKLRPVNLPRGPVALAAPLIRWLPASLLDPLMRRSVGRGRGGKEPSLQSDLLCGRSQTEGAYLYGAIARTAQRLGLTAPVNATLWDVLDRIVKGIVPWETFRYQPEQLLAAVAAYPGQGPATASSNWITQK